MTGATWRKARACLATLAVTPLAHAAHPLQTEDTGTQGTGNVEWENGFSSTRTDGAKTVAYQPQFSYGLTPSIDLIAQPAWARRSDAGGASARGFGDTNLDAKWRFVGGAPLSLAVRAGITLPTHQHNLGLPHGDASPHAVLVATCDAAPVSIHANVGVAQFPAGSGVRRRIVQVSAAMMWAAGGPWTLTADAGMASDPDPARGSWPATVLVGVIYSVRPGLDLDAGYQSSVRSSVATRQWLVGITVRFAP